MSEANSRTRALVFGLTRGNPLIARETVAVDTWAAAATSSMLVAMVSS